MRGSKKNKSGRPPKFPGPRRPVTVTLPESTLAGLATIDSDRSRAIVKVTSDALKRHAVSSNHVEVVEVTKGLGIIVVHPDPILRKVKGLRLIEVAPARSLLTVASGTSIDSLELAILDAAEELSVDDPQQSILVDLKSLITSLRRQGVFSKEEMLLIDTGRTGVAHSEGNNGTERVYSEPVLVEKIVGAKRQPAGSKGEQILKPKTKKSLF